MSAAHVLAAGIGYYRLDIHASQAPSGPDFLFHDRGGIGGNLGLGRDFAIGDTGLKVFTDIRYYYAATDNFRVRMIPIEVGVRW